MRVFRGPTAGTVIAALALWMASLTKTSKLTRTYKKNSVFHMQLERERKKHLEKANFQMNFLYIVTSTERLAYF